jgi:predicted NBD/HSP70 family sugar kinase
MPARCQRETASAIVPEAEGKGKAHVKSIVRAFDFGGSGVKTASYDVSSSTVRRVSPVESHVAPDYDNFAEWLRDRVTVREHLVGVSCAGFVDLATGVNHRWNDAGLMGYPLAEELRRVYPDAESIRCLSDAEAHLWAALGEYDAPLLALAVGSSVGMALADEFGHLIRTRDDRPLECGTIRLRDTESREQAWWALGTPGLTELQHAHGEREAAARFGRRLGDFAAQFATLFHARTVVLSGGVIEHNWKRMAAAVTEAFDRGIPPWMAADQPEIHVSHWGREAALVGAAKFAHATASEASPHRT